MSKRKVLEFIEGGLHPEGKSVRVGEIRKSQGESGTVRESQEKVWELDQGK